MAKISMHDTLTNRVLISMGANSGGCWGPPQATLSRSIVRLRAIGFDLSLVSRLYLTRPHGLVRQQKFVNAVVCGTSRLPPARLLQELKVIERAAGRRRVGLRNGPRPLDLDLIDFGGRRIGWRERPRGVRPALVLPHPHLHARPFVLRPLLDVAPHWRHPVLGRTARQLLAAAVELPHDVEPVLDSNWPTCDKNIR